MARRLPSLKALRAFEAAGRHLSFTRAAEELFVTQAAISHQVKHLEEELGEPLFRRFNRRLELTVSGRRLLEVTGDALDRIAAVTESISSRSTGQSLAIACLGSFASRWLLPRLPDFNRRNPGINVLINASPGLTDFDREPVDLAIRYGRGYWPGLESEFLMTDRVFPVCSPEYLESGPPLERPEDLAHHTLLHDGSETGEFLFVDWRAWMAAAGVSPDLARPGPGFTDALLMLQAAAQGQGIALGRASICAEDLAIGRLVRPFELEMESEAKYYFVTPPHLADVPRVASFREWLFEQVAETEDISPEVG